MLLFQGHIILRGKERSQAQLVCLQEVILHHPAILPLCQPLQLLLALLSVPQSSILMFLLSGLYFSSSTFFLEWAPLSPFLMLCPKLIIWISNLWSMTLSAITASPLAAECINFYVWKAFQTKPINNENHCFFLPFQISDNGPLPDPRNPWLLCVLQSTRGF